MSKLKKIIILTGSEIRHDYFRIFLSNDCRYKIVKTICESNENSLKKRIFNNIKSSKIEKRHVINREKQEIKSFSGYNTLNPDNSNSLYIKKGNINSPKVTNLIEKINPDLIISYGSSIIKTRLISSFKNKFINIHLGLSPYYRGSGSNVWPIVNNDLEKIGATFMHIDKGIDTGQIIHQIRVAIKKNDNPHTIGNRVIKEMTKTTREIIINFDDLYTEKQPKSNGVIYYHKDFNEQTCKTLYKNLKNGIINTYLDKLKNSHNNQSYIVRNRGLNK